ncbi:MAG: RpiB/LacA/LacB family sugar-phosphate isomerase [Anaerolineales bacterium]|nr:RpiB/LacA/LacB family sugar-phosphate isomerase [Anaerolineales bacterium]
MKIAVVSETSAGDKNADIQAALDGRGHTIINAGMKRSGEKPELQYYHTGLIAGILINLGKVDFVVGGCGTGQGFVTAVVQYPGVFCGHILTPLDAWLFAQINGGNCISLTLNQGYGWAGDINLRLIFDALFSVEFGSGYPEHRRIPQKESRDTLVEISRATHKPFSQIITDLPTGVIQPVIAYPGMKELIDVDSIDDPALKTAFRSVMQ